MTSAKRFEDLVCWQLSEELKERVIGMIGRERVRRDHSFCDDIRRSARSAPANIAEGFGLYDPGPNRRHAAIAKGSLNETKNHILEAFKRNYVDEKERDELLLLARRAIGATRNYIQYLKSCKSAPTPTARTGGTGTDRTAGTRTHGTPGTRTRGTTGTRTRGTTGT